MSKAKAVLKFIGEFIIILGAFACILVWLEVKPNDFRGMTLPHWMWLFTGLGLFAIAISSSSYSLWRSFRDGRSTRKKLIAEHEAEMLTTRTSHRQEIESLDARHRDEIRRVIAEHIQELEQEHADLEKCGQLSVLADEARMLWQMIEKTLSEARMLGDDKAAKVLEHPFDPSPVREFAESGQGKWHLLVLSRFQAAYNEHHARISNYSPLAKPGIYQNVDENVSIQSAIKMLRDHQQALLDHAAELRKPYENQDNSHREVREIEPGSPLDRVAKMTEEINKATEPLFKKPRS